MNRAFLAAVLVLVVTTAVVGSAIAKTTITPIGTMGTWYIATDEPIRSYSGVEWVPNTLPDKRDKRIDPETPGLVSVLQFVERAACWRLDEGNPDDIRWNHVRTMLRVKHGIVIGLPVTCCASGDAVVPECMRVSMSLYVPHERRCFRVEQNGNVAVISVMIPTGGILTVYTDAEPLEYYNCDGPTPYYNPSPICASMGDVPSVGQDCMAGENGDDTRRKYPRIELVTVPGEQATTWGCIKALYRSED